ncbi:MAG: SH3 domain-containing protein [Clostridia bacterium]|nr:SH3 domain-containing protein [Clostridia bacterium]
MRTFFRLAAALALTLLLTLTAAMADSARVMTPGGKLRVRKTPDSKARLVVEVPNRSLVDVEAVEGDWVKITYKNKTGYAMLEYLRVASLMPGRTVYSDEGDTVLRQEPSDTSAIVGVAAVSEGLYVAAVEDDWALIEIGGVSGYAPVSGLSYQWEEPQGTAEWMSLPGETVNAVSLRADIDPAAPVTSLLSQGTAVTVTLIRGDQCLALSEAGCGWTSAVGISLTPPEEAETEGLPLSPLAASAKASEALKKAYKAFSSENLYACIGICDEMNGLAGPLYRVAFLNDAGQYLYSALIRMADGQALVTADCRAFAAPPEEGLLPEGEMTLSLSADTIAVGEVLDVEVQAWTRANCRYTLLKDGVTQVKGEDTTHFKAAYRPRAAGNYTLTVRVSDGKGGKAERTASFTVTEAEETPPEEIYSQKDGWWRRKPYGDSTLDKSGCAIFTLSHALTRMGRTGEDLLPVNLARRYGRCLTVDGTNNERLLREASNRFEYATQPGLIEDAGQIAELLREGALFSFSIVRGHIALIDGLSEDGTMVHIVDSAPTATFTRIKDGSLYIQRSNGSWRAVTSLDSIPGARYYFETDHYGGLEYWMELSYAAKRGVRLILPNDR